MSSEALSAATAELMAALNTVEDVRAYSDLGARLDPPATVLGPPSLQWEAMCNAPTSARFLVYVVVGVNERALELLWDLVPAVAEALDRVPGAVVIRADPGTYLNGGPELPCYLIQVDVAL